MKVPKLQELTAERSSKGWEVCAWEKGALAVIISQ